MPRFVALLRAVNVGGTGKLPMAELAAMGMRCGFGSVRTYIASGNLVFDSDADEVAVRAALAGELHRYAGKLVGVIVRSGGELAGVVAGNPFAAHPGNRVVALFVDAPLSTAALDAATGVGGEVMRLGERVIYIHYGDGMATSRLKIPVAVAGTARNMNTVARLAAMASAPSDDQSNTP